MPGPIKRSLGRAARQVAAWDLVLPWIEARLPAASDAQLTAKPPVLILGAPRSGTCLLFECLVVGLRLACLPNLADAFFRSPALALHATRRLGIQPTRFIGQSKYGRMRSIGSPSEAGAWRRWWTGGRRPHEPLSGTQLDRLDASLRRIAHAAATPVCLKDTYNVHWLEAFAGIAPTTVVIHLKRDARYVAQSLLVGRREKLGDERKWLGVRPPGHEAYAARSPIEQVAWQATELDRYIKRQCDAAGLRRLITTYESLCEAPRSVATRLANQLASAGIELPPMAIDRLPERLDNCNQQRLDAGEWESLAAAIASGNPQTNRWRPQEKAPEEPKLPEGHTRLTQVGSP